MAIDTPGAPAPPRRSPPMPASRTRKIIFTGAAALGIAAGAAGIAAAATSQSSGGTGTTSESHDDPIDYTSSVTVNDSSEATSESEEAKALAKLATVTPDEAVAAAVADTPGMAS